MTSHDAELLAALVRLDRKPGDILKVTPLAGTGNTSRLVEFADDRLVIRFDGEETSGLVHRGHEFRHARLAAEQGLGPDVVLAESDDGLLVTRFHEGNGLDHLQRPFAGPVLHRLGDLIVRLQACDGFGGIMDPWSKIALYLEDAGIADPADNDAFGDLWAALYDLRATTSPDPGDLVACHIDPVPENIMDDGERAVFIDWEYAALSHRLWDAAYFASEADLAPGECAALLAPLGRSNEAGDLTRWIIVAKAVSYAWCLARRHRSVDDAATWDKALIERRTVLQKVLQR